MTQVPPATAPLAVATVAAVAAAVLVAGCSSGTEPAPALPLCDGAANVRASNGLTPELTWTPACRADRLRVYDQFGELYWDVQAPEPRIGPGVRYGASQAGWTERTEPRPLEGGTLYVAVLSIGNIAMGGGTFPAVPFGTLPICETVFDLRAGPGFRPVFSWAPRCAVPRLTIHDERDPSDPIWTLSSVGAVIGPDVRYGEVPEGATASGAAPVLVAGDRYVIKLWSPFGGYYVSAVFTVTP